MFYFEDIFIKKDKKKIIEIFDYINIELNNFIYNEVVMSDVYKVRLTDEKQNLKI